MNTLDQVDPTNQKGIFALFKGASGAGKSVAALSFPKPYVFDYDRKMPAIAQKHFPKKSIEYDYYSNVFDVDNKLKGWLQKQDCPYETLIHDSITNLSALVIHQIGEVRSEDTMIILERMKKDQKKVNKIEFMDFDYYKGEMRMFDHILGLSKRLWAAPGNPKNIIFTAHIMTNEQTNIMTKFTTVTRSIVCAGTKVAAFVPTQFDELYTFSTQESGGMDGQKSRIRRFVLTETEGPDDAKTAYSLDKSIEFTDKNFYNILQEQIAGQHFNNSL